ncbi:hypothetical protein [Streptosporangium longisporum]|uniref:Uncharacterized protein n=1 Tax=Streptosporangium longisporum TaxID=46187 RepID=A0ABN3Y054_9ACTN
MRKSIQFVGLVLTLQGVSGTIDHLVGQPFFGVVLNFFNRFVVENVAFLEGREIYANLILAALGLIMMIAAERAPSS